MDIRNFFGPANGGKSKIGVAAPTNRSTSSVTAGSASASGKKGLASKPARKRKIVEEDTDDDEIVEINPSQAEKHSSQPENSSDVAASSSQKKAEVPAEVVDPTDFFGGGKVKRSEKTTVGYVEPAPLPKASRSKKAKADDSAGTKQRGATPKAVGSENKRDDVDIDDGFGDMDVETLRKIAELEERELLQLTGELPVELSTAKTSAAPSAKTSPARPPIKSSGKSNVKAVGDESTKFDEPAVPAHPETTSSSKRKADVAPENEDGLSKKARPSPSRASNGTKEIEEKSKAKVETLPRMTEEEQIELRKKNFAKVLEKKKNGGSGPLNPGSKIIPTGEPNCLDGLTFVLTGEYEELSREGAEDLIKRYGGRLTSSISGKTDYIVVGADPGESKLKKAEDKGTKRIDEDGLMALVATLKGRPEPKGTSISSSVKKAEPAASMSSVKAAIQSSFYSSTSGGNSARLMGNDKENQAIHASKPGLKPPLMMDSGRKGGVARRGEMWTTKYKPKTYDDIMGNKGNVQKIAAWLKAWDPNGVPPKTISKEAPGGARAILISGPPGIGKTTSAHLVAASEGFEAIEFNASDTRSKKSVKDVVKEMTGCHTISEFYGAKNSKSKGRPAVGKKQVLIMDEVDGMSSGDRGGIGELIAIIKKTKVPIICICNDRQSQKLKSLANSCYDMRFYKPKTAEIEAKIKKICEREGLTLKYSVVDTLMKSTQGDIRQILNMLENYALDATVIDFDGSKALGKSAEKDMSTNMWDIAAKLLNRVSFREMNFVQKLELYFQDHAIIPLMIHENYMKMAPSMAADVEVNGEIGTMRLLSGAADACRDGDLIDSVLRKTNNWGLMPLHGAISTVRPAFFMHGQVSGPVFGATGGFAFPGWLGKNSTQGKTTRQLRDLHAHMRLKVSADKEEIRLNYLPVLAPRLTIPMARRGAEGIDEIIELMDEYFIDREAWEALLEMGLGKNESKKLLMNIPATVKSAFTRQYNKASHPQPMMTAVTAAKGKAVKAAMPDLEDAFEVEEDALEEEDEEIEGDGDVVADKMIKKKSVGRGAAKKGDDAKGKAGPSKAKGGTGRGNGKV
ncbi:hypothetical protein HK101_010669 [Irineochytrium annulatum]|nr:hypothetical protein HK101_010669 [Irineochytrium annulatum]